MADEQVMDIRSLDGALEWQARHAALGHAPCTARIIAALKAVAGTDTEVARRINNWPGLKLQDAMPLRITGGLHHLHLTGDAPELAAIYSGELADQGQIDAIVVRLVERFDARLSPWLDGPPQTNEAGRSASLMAGLLWLSRKLGPRFEVHEIGASAGINTMMERYFYDLGGTQVGPKDSPMRIAPEWKGGPPPGGEIAIVSIRGCDVAPIDLSDPEQALRLKAYVWGEMAERMARLDAAIALARQKKPDLVRQDAAEFVRAMLARPQQPGVARVLDHSIMWQYLPQETRDEITRAMEAAGARATPERPLAWVSLETNRETFAHELKVKYWPGGSGQWAVLAQAHPHGLWVEWYGV